MSELGLSGQYSIKYVFTNYSKHTLSLCSTAYLKLSFDFRNGIKYYSNMLSFFEMYSSPATLKGNKTYLTVGRAQHRDSRCWFLCSKNFFCHSRSSDISCLLIFSFSHVLVYCFWLLSKGLWHLKPLLQGDSNLHLPTQHLVSVCTVGIMLGYYITLHCKHLHRDKCVTHAPTFTIWASFLFQ